MAIKRSRIRFTQERNWTKRRLMGFIVNEESLSKKEKDILKAIKNNIKVLLNEWDQESIKMGLKPLPYFKIFYEESQYEYITKDKKIIKEAKKNGAIITKI